MLTIHDLSYIHINKDLLFTNINMVLNKQDKTALIGNNGIGKSTLLQIITKQYRPSNGSVAIDSVPYYIPQIFGQFNHLTIAEALAVDKKITALHEILCGNISEENHTLLNDDWTIEERCIEALQQWKLEKIDLSQKMETLSGGQKTKVFLAGITIHHPDFVLMDEPSNHLDIVGKALLYDFVKNTKSTLLIVSHDRTLLNLLTKVCELTKTGINSYGGNYEFYVEQKQIEATSLTNEIQSSEKSLRKAKEKERKTNERQQKLDVRAKKNLGKAGLPKIVANNLRNSAERSTSKLAGIHNYKTEGIVQELQVLRSAISEMDKIKFEFKDTKLHKGKILFKAQDINFSYAEKKNLWRDNLTFQIISGERIALQGTNSSGKTTLIKIILNQIKPQTGAVFSTIINSTYIDQDYSLIDNNVTVYEQAQRFNKTLLQAHEIKTRLNRFLLTKDHWDRPCWTLSGGERMRLILCCITINNQAPDIIVLDEPTNNLDIQNIEILVKAINAYQGTILVVSHDIYFLNQITIQRTIKLSN